MKEIEQTPDYISKQVELSRLFFIEPSPDQEFAVASGGFERCRPDYRIDRSSLDWYCLEFVDRGEGKLNLNGADYDLHPGSFFIYGPNTPHRIQTSSENPLGKYFVTFHGRQVEGFLKQHEIEVATMAYCHRGESVRRAFSMLIERGVRKSKLTESLCSLIVRELLLLCLDDSAGNIDTDSPAYLTYSRARQYIENGYLELQSLDAVAKGCGVEAAYLCRLFARFHDESPYQFLTRLRMDHASRLLLEDGSSVRSVAQRMGYKDPFHFSRVFKSVHRIPPSKFRNSLYS
ncbi:MAG: AraC family transcriptional regulator [Luteolibacter sp.]